MNPFVKCRLQDKVVIITGGSGGIGAATVRLFAYHGAKVIIADIAEDTGMELADSLSPWATYVHCDVGKEEDVSGTLDLAVEKHGRLDVMYNNTGVPEYQKLSVAEYYMSDFERVMNINVKGVMHGNKHAVRVMIPNRKGSIISTASITEIGGGLTPYSYTASKHGVIGEMWGTSELYISYHSCHRYATEIYGSDPFSRGKGQGVGDGSRRITLKGIES